MKIGFIGLGNMATAMIGGIINGGIASKEDIYGSAHTKESVEKAVKSFGITGCDTNSAVAKNAEVLILAVKPQMYEEVMAEIKNDIKENAVVISIAPGKTLSWLKERLPESAKVVRCMPNTPALVGEGCTGACRDSQVEDADMDKAMTVLGSFGKAYEIKESMMDAVLAVSGSSPAYIFMFIEAMADGAVEAGMTRDLAYKFAAQSLLGSAKMVLDTNRHPADLKDMVCSPAGTTIEAVRVLEEKGFRGTVISAMKAAVDKARGM